MDPVGPWATYTSPYNRLTAASASYQLNSPGGRDFGPSLHLSPTGNNSLSNPAGGGMPSANQQLLLQTAHNSVNLAGGQITGHPAIPSAFGAGSFLSQPTVAYDPVFPSLFQHSHHKSSNYNTCVSGNPQKQPLTQSTVTKQNTLDSELAVVRENRNSSHQQNNSYFEQQAAVSPSSLSSPPPWSHQGNTQLPSPFGILPHETVGNGMEKSNSSVCDDNNFSIQFPPTQNLSHVTPQLTPVLEFNKSSGSYNKIQARKANKSSPPVRTMFTPASSTSSVAFYQHSPVPYNNIEVASSPDNCPIETSYRSDSNKCQQQLPVAPDFVNTRKTFAASPQLSAPYRQSSLGSKSSVATKECDTQQPLSQSSDSTIFLGASTSAQFVPDTQPVRNQTFLSLEKPRHHVQSEMISKMYSEFNSSEHLRQTQVSDEQSQSQSPPINFTVLDTVRQTASFAASESSGTCSTSLGSASISTSLPLGVQQNKCALGRAQHPQFQSVHGQQHSSDIPYQMQNYSNSITECPSYCENNPRSSITTETKSYSEPLLSATNGSSKLSGRDCSNALQIHSPASTHSQQSPLAHTTSPVYPLYNSPVGITSVSYIEPQSPEVSLRQCSEVSEKQQSVNCYANPEQCAPQSPNCVTAPQAITQRTLHKLPYPSVIIRAQIPNESDTKENSKTENVSHGSNAINMVVATQKTNSAEGHKFLQPQEDTSSRISEKLQACSESSSPDCQQPSVDAGSSAGTESVLNNTVLSLQQKENQIQEGKVLLSSAGGVDTCTEKHSIPVSDASNCIETQQNTTPENQRNENITKKLSISHPTETGVEQEQHNFDSENSCLNIPSTSPQATTESDDSSRQQSSIFHGQNSSDESGQQERTETITKKLSISHVTGIDVEQEQQNFVSENCCLNIPSSSPQAATESDDSFRQQASVLHGQNPSDESDQQQSVTANLSQISSSQELSNSTQQSVEDLKAQSEVISDIQDCSVSAENISEKHQNIVLVDIEDDLELVSERNSSTCAGSSVAVSILCSIEKVGIPEQKCILQNCNGFLEEYMKFLHKEEGNLVLSQSRNAEKTSGKEAVHKIQRKRITVTGNSVTKKTKFTGINSTHGTANTAFDQQDDAKCFTLSDEDEGEEQLCHSDVPSDMSGMESERNKRKEIEELQLKKYQQEEKVNEKKRRKIDREERREKSRTGREHRAKSVQEAVTELRHDSKATPDVSLKYKPLNCSDDVQSLDLQNSCEVEQKKRNKAVKEQVTTKKKIDQRKEGEQTLPLPRRETTPRKAKEISNAKKYLSNSLEEFDEDTDFEDSDSDPAWTPAAKEPPDDDPVNRRRSSRRTRPALASCKRRRDDSSPPDNEDLEVKKLRGNRSRQNHARSHTASVAAEHSPSPVNAEHFINTDPPVSASFREAIADTSFRSGDFVVMKREIGMEHPSLWRIDGRTLLQKYERFEQNGKSLYKNISTYTSWTAQNRHIYQQVPVRFVVQNHFETVVELQRGEVGDSRRALIEQSVTETAKYYSNFEVYIQTLISQALDSNFLTEVFREHDEYFLSNVRTVDEVTEERKGCLLRIAKWPSSLRASVGTWPCFNVIDEPTDGDGEGAMPCIACEHSSATARVQMYGQPYDRTTLEGCQPDPKVAAQKDFLLCKVCVSRVELYNKVAHQKYQMYVECAKRIADKRSTNHNKDSMEILNELLADDPWLNELFLTVRSVWAEIDTLDHQMRNNMI